MGFPAAAGLSGTADRPAPPLGLGSGSSVPADRPPSGAAGRESYLGSSMRTAPSWPRPGRSSLSPAVDVRGKAADSPEHPWGFWDQCIDRIRLHDRHLRGHRRQPPARAARRTLCVRYNCQCVTQRRIRGAECASTPDRAARKSNPDLYHGNAGPRRASFGVEGPPAITTERPASNFDKGP